MQHNPYSPPAVDVSSTPIVALAKKPKSAWLIQIISTIIVILLIIGLANDMITIVIKGSAPLGSVSPQRLFMFMTLRVALLALCVSVVWGVEKRKLYARICGTLVIAAMLAWFTYRLLFVNSINGAEAFGEFVGKTLITCGAAYWFYAFGFSPKTQRYFSTDNDESQDSRV